MEAILADEATIYDDSFLNMKVADLKRELKSRGLPVSGTKGELLERLQSAETASKDAASLSDPETNPDVDDEILNDSVIALDVSPIDVKPLKKRIIVMNDSIPPTPEKKISLNRATAISVPPPPSSSEPVKIKHVAVEAAASATLPNKNVISLKTMSVQEKLAMRAQRFNVTTSSGTTALQTTTNTSPVKSNVLNVDTGTKAPNLEILKKRAERFGENVSKVMKQLEVKERVLKRKMRFGATPTTTSSSGTSDESEQKRLRAQRFGL